MTEQEIRGLSIGFLKNHYKFRPHKVWNGIQVRNERHDIDGIIIDASLTYVQQDGSRFLATVEASSLDRSKEVNYRFHWFKLLFEAITLSLLITAIVYGILANPWSNWLASVGQPGGWTTAFQLFVFCVGLFTLSLLAAFRKRYRYIYAVEQFKLFHADDQWIAYDAELFHTHEDKSFRELERQCMYYGFGLLQVERDRRIRIMVSPKRGDYFGQKRKKLPVWAAALSQAPLVGKALENRVGGVIEVDETIQLKDPLAEMNFELPGEERPELPAPPPSTSVKNTGLVDRLKTLVPGATTVTKPRATAPAESWQKKLRREILGMRPAFARELPGFFTPPARWWSLFLFAVACNLAILAWRAGEEAIVPAITKEEKLKLERTFEKRAPAGPGLEADLNDPSILEDDFGPNLREADQTPVVDQSRLDQLAPKAASDVMLYSLGALGDTLVSDRCLSFTRSGQKLYGMVFARYNDLDAALEDAFRLHTDLRQDILVTKGDCLQQPATNYLVMIGKPSADEGEINLRFRRLRGDAGLDVEILSFE